jgi:hypothetical protein
VDVGVLVQQSGQHGAAGTGETCEEVELADQLVTLRVLETEE